MHTPGPWWIDEYGGIVHGRASRDKVVINGCQWTQSDARREEFLANQRLVAAAPELLVALKDILRIAKAATLGTPANKRIERAEAAITKAEGK